MMAARLVCAAFVTVVLVLTLTPDHESIEGRAAFRIQSAVERVAPAGSRSEAATTRARQQRALDIANVIDVLANIAMFVPLGVAAALGWPSRRWWLVALLSVVSGLIELTQLLFIPSRSAQLSDWIANSLGAALGVLLAGWVARFMRAARCSCAVALAVSVPGPADGRATPLSAPERRRSRWAMRRGTAP